MKRKPKENLLIAVANNVTSTIPRIIGFPGYLLNIPVTIFANFVGSAPRGFGLPKFISDVSAGAVIAVAAIGTCDVAWDFGKKVVSASKKCQTCNGWDALQCTMCKGSGKVMYQVKNYTLRTGEKATATAIANAITENRAELVHFPAVLDLNIPLPSKDCPTCDASGVMGCPVCKQKKFPFKLTEIDILEHPSRAHNILEKNYDPREGIISSMKDHNIAAFLFITMPQIFGGFEYDGDFKKKLWWHYKESMRYDQLRGAVAERKPGWEHLQAALISFDPDRARNDPVIVENIPYHKAKYALETEVMKLKPPPPPKHWEPPELDLPLDASSWSEVDLKDPKKLNEMKVLLDAQREIAKNIIDSQWEKEWREKKLNKMLEEKLKEHTGNLKDCVLPQPIVMKKKIIKMKMKMKKKRRWWWFF